jgi:hypothetical protein
MHGEHKSNQNNDADNGIKGVFFHDAQSSHTIFILQDLFLKSFIIIHLTKNEKPGCAPLRTPAVS